MGTVIAAVVAAIGFGLGGEREFSFRDAIIMVIVGLLAGNIAMRTRETGSPAVTWLLGGLSIFMVGFGLGMFFA